ncbi:MAG TPA: GNAT family N-acetyltransferase [Dehalococcoidia bacterium]|nr:GNAT family N-acetyltransferase [Dehalococcoidia bacterium]
MPENDYLPSGLTIDPVTSDEVPLALEFIRGLAEYEHEPEAVKTTPEQLSDALFGPAPAAEAVIARLGGAPAGFALWTRNYSTWTGQPGLWLEDIFIKPEYRRHGIGKALMIYLARLCQERGYGRFEWSVLDWNTPAIDFYRALGAESMDEWTINRLSGDALKRLADG